MDQERLIKAVIMDLKLDYIKLEEKLEVMINDERPLDERIKKIKKLLNKIVVNEMALERFVGLTIEQISLDSAKTEQNG